MSLEEKNGQTRLDAGPGGERRVIHGPEAQSSTKDSGGRPNEALHLAAPGREARRRAAPRLRLPSGPRAPQVSAKPLGNPKMDATVELPIDFHGPFQWLASAADDQTSAKAEIVTVETSSAEATRGRQATSCALFEDCFAAVRTRGREATRGTERRYLFGAPTIKRAGLYMWTYPTTHGELVYYIGQTGRSFEKKECESTSSGTSLAALPSTSRRRSVAPRR
jgi:hypothetical protein